jgi:hypothetical protein
MAGFSPTDAALEGFRITRERPRVFLAWIVFSFVVSAAGVVLTLLMPDEATRALESLGTDDPPDPQAFLDILAILAPLLLYGLAVQRTLDAAVYRLMLRPTRERVGCLAFGADEMRLMVLRLIYVVLAVLYVFVAQIVIGLVAFAASALGQSAMLFVASVGELFSLGLLLYVAVRLSLSSVITFDRRKLSIRASWTVTRGQVWPLLGAYVLALSCAVVLGLLALVLFTSVAGIVLVATGGSLADLKGIIQPEDISLKTYLNPFVIAYMLVGSVFTAVYSAVIPAPGGFAYRQLRGELA